MYTTSQFTWAPALLTHVPVKDDANKYTESKGIQSRNKEARRNLLRIDFFHCFGRHFIQILEINILVPLERQCHSGSVWDWNCTLLRLLKMYAATPPSISLANSCLKAHDFLYDLEILLTKNSHRTLMRFRRNYVLKSHLHIW